MYRRGEAQGGMPVFEQPRGHRTRASNDLACEQALQGTRVGIEGEPARTNTVAKRTTPEYKFELPVNTHFRLCIKIQCKQDKIPYREV